ncbi:hypothetical protein HK16_06570 [Acetobacter senegalensis]|uniref:Uncharacterized protein n=2 Tax=Acetobacter TaxID=434 RepID=A0A252EL16_9PROT|nr:MULTISPECIES: hypothetical protein [Acetobacter]ATJ90007.1 hypothetical protein CIW82_04175 [Acetobacter tropicalis]OUL66992.1 hypothetical protein HK16_06570 [Acetobacter senegalensis]
MSSPSINQATFSLEWQAKYIRRAASVADALAQFAAGEGRSDPEGDVGITAGGCLFLSSYLGMIADEAEGNVSEFKGAAQ